MKAQENYRCAQDAMAKGRFNVVASRIYYALILASSEYIRKKTSQSPDNWDHARYWRRVHELSDDPKKEALMTTWCVLRKKADYSEIPIKRRQLEAYSRQEETGNLLNFFFRESIGG